MKRILTALVLGISLLFVSGGTVFASEFLKSLEKQSVLRLEFQLSEICRDLENRFELDFALLEKLFMILFSNRNRTETRP